MSIMTKIKITLEVIERGISQRQIGSSRHYIYLVICLSNYNIILFHIHLNIYPKNKIPLLNKNHLEQFFVLNHL